MAIEINDMTSNEVSIDTGSACPWPPEKESVAETVARFRNLDGQFKGFEITGADMQTETATEQRRLGEITGILRWDLTPNDRKLIEEEALTIYIGHTGAIYRLKKI